MVRLWPARAGTGTRGHAAHVAECRRGHGCCGVDGGARSDSRDDGALGGPPTGTLIGECTPNELEAGLIEQI
jgi:hypothetical protein